LSSCQDWEIAVSRHHGRGNAALYTFLEVFRSAATGGSAGMHAWIGMAGTHRERRETSEIESEIFLAVCPSLAPHVILNCPAIQAHQAGVWLEKFAC